MNFLLDTIELNNPYLSFEIIEWIYSKLTYILLSVDNNIVYGKLLALFYFNNGGIEVNYKSDIISSVLPIDLYIAVHINAAISNEVEYLEKLSRAKKPRKSFSLELANLIIDQFLKSQNPDELKLAKKIIKKLK